MRRDPCLEFGCRGPPPPGMNTFLGKSNDSSFFLISRCASLPLGRGPLLFFLFLPLGTLSFLFLASTTPFLYPSLPSRSFRQRITLEPSASPPFFFWTLRRLCPLRRPPALAVRPFPSFGAECFSVFASTFFFCPRYGPPSFHFYRLLFDSLPPRRSCPTFGFAGRKRFFHFRFSPPPAKITSLPLLFTPLKSGFSFTAPPFYFYNKSAWPPQTIIHFFFLKVLHPPPPDLQPP